jgi:8-amino-7-oxononanoate synthase
VQAREKDLSGGLQVLAEKQLYRRRRLVERRQASPLLKVDGRDRLVFCSNDYLGLAHDPRLIAAQQESAARWGSGSGASHLVTGHSSEHHALEEEIADFTGRTRALLFSTGYMANLGVVDALASRGDLIVSDDLNHASLIDGARISGATVERFRHANPASARECFDKHSFRRGLIISDGVFSMDGDVAPLLELANVADSAQAWLVIDDAHGLGVLGPGGGGCVAAARLGEQQVPALIGTFGKAFGSFGAFVAGSESLIETLINKARTYVFTTALPAPVAAASRCALAIAREEGWRREHLVSLIQRFRKGVAALGLDLLQSDTAIQPIMIGGAGRALKVSEELWELGFWVAAIRPPTVPDGSSRLRVTLSAAHEPQQVDDLIDALSRCASLQ